MSISHGTLRNRILYLILALALPPVLLCGVYFYLHSREAMIRTEREKLSSLIDLTSSEIQLRIIQNTRALYYINDLRADSFSIVGLDNLPPLRRFLKVYPDFFALAIISPAGEIIASAGDSEYLAKRRPVFPRELPVGKAKLLSLSPLAPELGVYILRPDRSVVFGVF